MENPTRNESADQSTPRPRRGPPLAEIQNSAERGPSAFEDLSVEVMSPIVETRRHAACVRAALRAGHLFASTVLLYPVDSTLTPLTSTHVDASTALFRSGGTVANHVGCIRWAEEVLSFDLVWHTPTVRRTLSGRSFQRPLPTGRSPSIASPPPPRVTRPYVWTWKCAREGMPTNWRRNKGLVGRSHGSRNWRSRAVLTQVISCHDCLPDVRSRPDDRGASKDLGCA